MKMTNRRNQTVYRLWAPIYDAALGRLFAPGRRRAAALLDLQPGEQVLIVGVGTGADLPLLPEGIQGVGIDLSPDMLVRARARLPLPGREVTLLQGDAQQLLVPEASFDAVIFNLILSVVPDGRDCLHANLRAVRPGGRAMIFDKFQPEGARTSHVRRFLNLFSTLFGTDITRRFSDLIAGSGWEVVRDEPGILNGTYRVIIIQETNRATSSKLPQRR